MKRVVVAVQNYLVSEAILSALKRRGICAEKSFSCEPNEIASLCDMLFADVLVMDVTRFNEGSYNNRTEIVNVVKKSSLQIKVCLICDNVSDEELSFKVLNAKKLGLIDMFFYQSVPSDYIADMISTM